MSRRSVGSAALFFTLYGVQVNPGPPVPRAAMVLSMVIVAAAVHAV